MMDLSLAILACCAVYNLAMDVIDRAKEREEDKRIEEAFLQFIRNDRAKFLTNGKELIRDTQKLETALKPKEMRSTLSDPDKTAAKLYADGAKSRSRKKAA